MSGAGGDSHRLLPTQINQGSIKTVGGIAQAQLAHIVIPGGVNFTVAGHHDQMILAGGDAYHIGKILPLTIKALYLDLSGNGTADAGTIAQLAHMVETPSPHGTIGTEGCHETVTHGQNRHSNAHRVPYIHALRHSHIDGTGVVRAGIGHTDHCGTRLTGSHSAGGDVSNAATGSNIGHRAVGSDPLQVGTIRNTADRQRPAVDEQVESGEIGLQKVIAGGSVIDPNGIALLHGDVHGSQQGRIVQIVQGIGTLHLAGDAVDNISLIDYQSLGLHIAHLNRFGSDLVSGYRVSTHNAHVLFIRYLGVLAPGVDKAIGPNHSHPLGAGRQSQNALKVGAGVCIKGLALQDRSGRGDHIKAGLLIVADVLVLSVVHTDAQLTHSCGAPSVSVATLGDSYCETVTHMDTLHIGEVLFGIAIQPLHQNGLAGSRPLIGGGPFLFGKPQINLTTGNSTEGTAGINVGHIAQTGH